MRDLYENMHICAHTHTQQQQPEKVTWCMLNYAAVTPPFRPAKNQTRAVTRGKSKMQQED